MFLTMDMQYDCMLLTMDMQYDCMLLLWPNVDTDISWFLLIYGYIMLLILDVHCNIMLLLTNLHFCK